jgi:hypothetical protein
MGCNYVSNENWERKEDKDEYGDFFKYFRFENLSILQAI